MRGQPQPQYAVLEPRPKQTGSGTQGLLVGAAVVALLCGAVAFLLIQRQTQTVQAAPAPALSIGTVPYPAQAPKADAVLQPAAAPVPPQVPASFYMYRAQGQASYPLENVNTADLAGVLWYIHNEVVTSTPRKYHIDRVKRWKVTVKNTQEYWNVHHRFFGPFFAYDAARCTSRNEATGTNICMQAYKQYGFIVGCQSVAKDLAAYYAPVQTTTACDAGTQYCNAPLWYSLPGHCPSMGMANSQISANSVTQDVDDYKSPDCMASQPGGRCDMVTGAATCTYSVEDAGEILLDELAGISDYNYFWNTSYAECEEMVTKGLSEGPCLNNKEYDPATDAGVGLAFWDGRLDPDRCAERLEKLRGLWVSKFPTMPELSSPLCDFDMTYDQEFTWPVNHSGGLPSDWWQTAAALQV